MAGWEPGRGLARRSRAAPPTSQMTVQGDRLNIRGVLAAALAAATVTAAAVAAPAAAEAAARTQVSQVSQVSHRPAVRTVDLHAQFEKLRVRKTTSPRAGIVPPL